MRPRKNDRHLPACMYHRHGAYWYVKGGKWRRLAADLPTALAEYAALVDTSRRGGGMAELLDKVLAHIAPGLKPNTVTQYRLAAERLKVILVEFAPEQVRPRDVAAIKAHFSATPNMANRIITVLRIVFDHAVEWQMVEANPCVGIKRYREAKRDRLMTDEEFTRIRAAARHKAIPVVMDLCHLTGQRIGDVLGIKPGDVSEKGVAFTQQKTGARLLVAMTPQLAAVLEEVGRLWPADPRAATLLYTRGFRPYSYGTIKDAFNRAKEAAGVPDVTIHDMRAKSLTAADEAGLDPQRLAGHTDSRQTRRYIRHKKVAVAVGPGLPGR